LLFPFKSFQTTGNNDRFPNKLKVSKQTVGFQKNTGFYRHLWNRSVTKTDFFNSHSEKNWMKNNLKYIFIVIKYLVWHIYCDKGLKILFSRKLVSVSLIQLLRLTWSIQNWIKCKELISPFKRVQNVVESSLSEFNFC